MLRRGSNSTTVSEEEPSLDYHNEARQYEEKLIQVADMHAELMEFNARLTMQLTNRYVLVRSRANNLVITFLCTVQILYRDRLIKMLQTELECLRGPLNEDDLPTEPPCLIHIWIPSAFLTGQPSDIHHVYQVRSSFVFVLVKSFDQNDACLICVFIVLNIDLRTHKRHRVEHLSAICSILCIV